MSIRVLGRTLDPQGWKTATLADIWARRYRVRARLLQALVRRKGSSHRLVGVSPGLPGRWALRRLSPSTPAYAKTGR